MQPRALQLSLPLELTDSRASEATVEQPNGQGQGGLTIQNERTGPPDRRRRAPGDQPVGLRGIIGTASYLGVLAGVLMYLLVVLWPEPVPKLTATTGSDSAAAAAVKAAATAYWGCDPNTLARWPSDSAAIREAKCVRVFPLGTLLIWDEQRLLLIVIVAGALGTLLHALRSLSTYVGNRKFKESWLLMYLGLPITGSLIALVFYAVIRGGFSGPGTTVPASTPFAFAAMAFMVGLFSQVAAEKLKMVAESFFTKTQTSADAITDRDGGAVLRRAQRVASVNGGPQDAIDIEGSGFTDETRLEVNGHEKQPVVTGPNRLRLMLDAAELAALENGGELSVQLKNGDKNSSPALVVS